MDGKMLSADEAKALASLESREAMLSKIAGLMKSEMSKAAALFVGAQSKFLSVLDAYKASLPAAETAEPAATQPQDPVEAAEPGAEPEAEAEPEPEPKGPRNKQPQNRDQPEGEA